MTKTQIIEYLKENEHCPEYYYTQRDMLRIENKHIYCARCNALLAVFDDITALWELV